ncbi:type 1 glutamine amidotransferase domain-containing protein [Parvibaculum sp.]|uniref:type 1 glutamine amidotransferase domain-containing protein n=1 Tax=Parvibaculum sp. TaxID=2024848 RepID=UPI003BAAF51E
MKKFLIGFVLVAVALLVIGRFGLPPLMTALGYHPAYDGPRYTLEGGKALIVTTSHATLGEGGDPTGVFASEMTAPYYAFLEAGMDVDLASIEGGEIPVDPTTENMAWLLAAPADKRFFADPVLQEKVANSARIDDVDFASYDIVFLAGGWGAAYDLGTSDVLGEKVTEAWSAGRIVGGVCHGPLGLLNAKDENGAPLVEGRRLTAVTDKQVHELGIDITPQHPERELRAAGAKFESATAFRDFFANHITVDGRLATGQNQNAGEEVAVEMVKLAGGKP